MSTRQQGQARKYDDLFATCCVLHDIKDTILFKCEENMQYIVILASVANNLHDDSLKKKRLSCSPSPILLHTYIHTYIHAYLSCSLQ